MLKKISKNDCDQIYYETKTHGWEAGLKAFYSCRPELYCYNKSIAIAMLKRIVSYYNFNMQNLLKKEGFKLKQKRKPKPVNKEIDTSDPYWLWDALNEKERREVVKRYSELIKELEKPAKKKEAAKVEIRQLIASKLFCVTRQTVSKLKKVPVKIPSKTAKNKLDSIIKEAFLENRGLYGRERLSVFIAQKYNILINYRTLGRILNRLELKCKIRTKKKQREKKDTTAKLENIVNRDYNDNQNRNIYATDVTYVKSPKNIKQNHVYLSAIICHKTKQIISWKISTKNNLNLVFNNIRDL
ncbi:transposase, partial [Mycoplasma sp. M5725]